MHHLLKHINQDMTRRCTSSHENSVITEPESSLQSPQEASFHSNEESSSCSRDSASRTFKGDNLSFCVINFQSIGNKKTELHNCGRPWPAAYINFNQNIHQIQVLTKPLCLAQAIFYSLPNNEWGTKYRGLTYSRK